jgi:plasmid stabilization system protein ParE
VAHRLRFRPRAKDDLEQIYDFIADFAGADSADAIVAAIERQCRKLTTFPNRGTPHPELRQGLRTVPHGKAVIAYFVEARAVVIVRIRYAGQQLRPQDIGD